MSEHDKDMAFMVVTDDDLGDEASESATCPNCGQEHEIVYGERVERDAVSGEEIRSPSRLLGAVRCQGKLYAVSIAGRLLRRAGAEAELARDGAELAAAVAAYFAAEDHMDATMSDAYTVDDTRAAADAAWKRRIEMRRALKRYQEGQERP